MCRSHIGNNAKMRRAACRHFLEIRFEFLVGTLASRFLLGLFLSFAALLAFAFLLFDQFALGFQFCSGVNTRNILRDVLRNGCDGTDFLFGLKKGSARPRFLFRS